MHAATGILTSRGGMTSHAAVVARGMGKPCVAPRPSSRSTTASQRVTIAAGASVGGGRRDHARRRRRQVMLGAVPTVDPAVGRLRDADGVGRRATARSRSAPTPTRRTTRAPRAVRRRGHRPLPHRAHVLRRGAHPAVREMILADDADGRRAALAKLLPMQRAGLRRIFEPWTACRSRSACSTRRCTSSCRTSPTRSPRSPRSTGIDAATIAGARRAARDQPDARPPRLPPRHPVPRDLRDAGARDPRGGGAVARAGRDRGPRSWCRWSAPRASSS